MTLKCSMEYSFQDLRLQCLVMSYFTHCHSNTMKQTLYANEDFWLILKHRTTNSYRV